MVHTLFHDLGVETLYTDYSMGYTVRPMHILFPPCGLTLNKRNDRQRSPTAITQTNSSMCMRINVVGVVLSINDRRKRVSGRGLCEPFTKKFRLPDNGMAQCNLCATFRCRLVYARMVAVPKSLLDPALQHIFVTAVKSIQFLTTCRC